MCFKYPSNRYYYVFLTSNGFSTLILGWFEAGHDRY